MLKLSNISTWSYLVQCKLHKKTCLGVELLLLGCFVNALARHECVWTVGFVACILNGLFNVTTIANRETEIAAH